MRRPLAVAFRALFVFGLSLAFACGSDVRPPELRAAPEAPVRGALADREALATISRWQALPELGDATFTLQSSRDTGDDDEPTVTLAANGNRDMNHFLCASSAERREVRGLVPFVYAQETCEEPYVEGYVIARAVGSGTMTRLWLTAQSFAHGRASSERLRIYIDDDPIPRADVLLSEALDGSADPIFAPPWGVGAPSHLAWTYPVAFSTRIVVAIDELVPLNLYYHQTSLMMREGRVPSAAAQAEGVRKRAERLLDSATSTASLLPSSPLDASRVSRLGAGESRRVHELPAGVTIDAFSVRLDERDLIRADDIGIRIRFSRDQSREPDIDASLAELFLAGPGDMERHNLALRAFRRGETWTYVLRLPMPAPEGAEFELVNRATEVVDVGTTVAGRRSLPGAAYGVLGVVTQDVHAPPASPWLRVLSERDRGRLVGMCADLEGVGIDDGFFGGPLNFLEGDERLWFGDGRLVQGTGTEDYFSSAFYFVEGPFSTPTTAAWRVRREDGQPGHVSACRWHVGSEAIDFHEGLDFDLEIGPGQPGLLRRYRTTAFVYRALQSSR